MVLMAGVCLAASAANAPAKSAAQQKQEARKKFVLDVVRSAVALPQPDPQDRLRVLQSAAQVVAPVNLAMSRKRSREGAHLEAELLSSGQTPAVSMLSSGHADCATAAEFVETVPAAALPRAEESLVAAITSCKQAQEPARATVQAALADGIVAARPLLALIEITGPKTRWSQAQFTAMFASLPDDAVKQAPDFAAMFAQMAPVVDADVAREAGLKFLDWLAKQKDSGERSQAVNLVTGSLRQALGDKKYDQALASDVMAQSVARGAGQPAELEHPEEDTVSVLEAMSAKDSDHSDELAALPPSQRAREAAAHGFASGTSGDRRSADHYFDVAFSSLGEVWEQRSVLPNAPAVVEEVSEAAAQVDPVAALGRAQSLSDPSAQAISMLAVARVVVGQQN